MNDTIELPTVGVILMAVGAVGLLFLLRPAAAGWHRRRTERGGVSIVVLLLILALLVGGVGLFAEGLRWLLIIALLLLVAGALMGFPPGVV